MPRSHARLDYDDHVFHRIHSHDYLLLIRELWMRSSAPTIVKFVIVNPPSQGDFAALMAQCRRQKSIPISHRS